MKLADWGRAGLRQARLTRVGVAVLAALILAVTAAGTAAALATSRSPGASTARRPVAYNGLDGWAHGRARLAVIYVGGTTAFLRTPHWSRWSGSSAATTGTLWVDNCQPNCASGHFRTYPAQVTLSRVAYHKGAAFFSRMRLRYEHSGRRDYRFRWGTYSGATVPLWIGGPA
ncbi:MAG TPA: hypothetical protein VMH35_05800 [Streptosporangiaceae bacterium]|nr:hypothetical protein [Streptosporangiaceae bacterium]